MVGNLYQVKRPEDGAIVPLTCTQQQLDEVWTPAGYVVVPPGNAEFEAADEEQPGTSPSTQVTDEIPEMKPKRRTQK